LFLIPKDEDTEDRDAQERKKTHITQHRAQQQHIAILNMLSSNMLTRTKLHINIHNNRTRSISLLHKIATSGGSLQQDVDHAVLNVRQYDPAGYLPGRLLAETRMQVAYYAARSFWVESGLRFGSTAKVGANATPTDHIEWWQTGIDSVFERAKGSDSSKEVSSDLNHPTLRLLLSILNNGTQWSKQHFDDILTSRRNDINVKQYETLDELVHTAEQSCGR
jgi:hypothetical protein